MPKQGGSCTFPELVWPVPLQKLRQSNCQAAPSWLLKCSERPTLRSLVLQFYFCLLPCSLIGLLMYPPVLCCCSSGIKWTSNLRSHPDQHHLCTWSKSVINPVCLDCFLQRNNDLIRWIFAKRAYNQLKHKKLFRSLLLR